MQSKRAYTAILVPMSLVLGACGADLFGQDDGFRQKILRGCRTEDDCMQLRAEAQARIEGCAPNTIGMVRCSDARADLVRTNGLVDRYRRRSEQLEATQRAIREEEEELDRQVAQARERTAQREAERLVKEKAEQELESAWGSLDRAKCSGEGDVLACQNIQEFLFKYHTSKYGDVARETLSQGQALIAERNRIAEERRAKEESSRAKSSGGGVSGSGRAKCCDGTFSPSCGCGGGKGCCSRHGGVCGCE